MGIKKAFKFTFSSMQPSKWIGIDLLKDQAGLIKNLFHSSVLKKKESVAVNKSEMTFSEYQQALGMTDEALSKAMKQCRHIFIFCSVLALAVLFYSYSVFKGSRVISGAVTIILALLLAVNGWKEHLFYTQLKHRLVSINARRWFNIIVMKKR